MKKYIISGLLLVLLSWCSIDYNNEKDKKIQNLKEQVLELNKDKENELFNKKQKCANYKNNIQNKINWDLMEIFFSPIINSCIYSYESDKKLWIIDYLSNEEIYKVIKWKNKAECVWFNEKDIPNYVDWFSKSEVFCFNRFNSKILELKWK